LDLSEAAGGALRMNRTRLDLSSLLDQLVALYQPALADHQHEVHTQFDQSIEIDGDASLMRRMVGNLLDNELTHLPAECHIYIRLTVQNGFAELKIEDNGPDLPLNCAHGRLSASVRANFLRDTV
jgi:signal transduction histidine kinase